MFAIVLTASVTQLPLPSSGKRPNSECGFATKTWGRHVSVNKYIVCSIKKYTNYRVNGISNPATFSQKMFIPNLKKTIELPPNNDHDATAWRQAWRLHAPGIVIPSPSIHSPALLQPFTHPRRKQPASPPCYNKHHNF